MRIISTIRWVNGVCALILGLTVTPASARSGGESDQAVPVPGEESAPVVSVNAVNATNAVDAVDAADAVNAGAAGLLRPATVVSPVGLRTTPARAESAQNSLAAEVDADRYAPGTEARPGPDAITLPGSYAESPCPGSGIAHVDGGISRYFGPVTLPAVVVRDNAPDNSPRTAVSPVAPVDD
ncbi:hypothetical protein ACTPOK_11590 [Streptomyces inhibens]|uniref:hypothetical protein n=1 Tax=Streptomyces inhibens TaxID=2293571 RepID=UPI00402A85E3